MRIDLSAKSLQFGLACQDLEFEGPLFGRPRLINRDQNVMCRRREQKEHHTIEKERGELFAEAVGQSLEIGPGLDRENPYLSQRKPHQA